MTEKERRLGQMEEEEKKRGDKKILRDKKRLR